MAGPLFATRAAIAADPDVTVLTLAERKIAMTVYDGHICKIRDYLNYWLVAGVVLVLVHVFLILLMARMM